MPRGNPTKLTPEVQAAILPMVRVGRFKADIAACLGIHRDTIHEWLTRGERESEGIYTDFATEFRAAEADFVNDSIALVIADPKGHRGLQWFLEKRFPEQFGTARIKAEVSGPNGGPVPVSVDASALNDRIEQLAAQFAGAAVEGAASAGPGGDDAGGAADAAADGGGTGEQ